MRKIRKIIVLLAVVIPMVAQFGFVACKSPQPVAVATYKTLATVQAAVAEARNAFVAANHQGLVSPETVAKALDANAKFHAAFAVAIAASASAQDPSPENVTAAASEFISLVYSFVK